MEGSDRFNVEATRTSPFSSLTRSTCVVRWYLETDVADISLRIKAFYKFRQVQVIIRSISNISMTSLKINSALNRRQYLGQRTGKSKTVSKTGMVIGRLDGNMDGGMTGWKD